MAQRCLFILSALLLSRCSPQQITEFRDTAKDTTQRADQIAQIKREVDSIDLQLKVYTALKLASSDSERLALARIYFRSFEFQKWTGETLDTVEAKEGFYQKAFYLFLPLITGSIPRGYLLEQQMIDSDWRLLGIMAVAMDEIDPLQQTVSAARAVPAESINSLIEKVLLNKDETMASRTFAPLVQQYRNQCIFLLQIRQNYLKALAVEHLTGSDFGLIDQLYIMNRPLTRTELNPALVNEAKRLMAESRRVQDVLSSLGITPVENPVIARRLSQLMGSLPAGTL